MSKAHSPGGMAGFIIIWLGPVTSVLATLMTLFVLTIWVFVQTGSATALALMQVFFITPFLIISPFAGVMVDRCNRKLMMMPRDLAGGLGTVVVLILQGMALLELWHLYGVVMVFGLGTPSSGRRTRLPYPRCCPRNNMDGRTV